MVITTQAIPQSVFSHAQKLVALAAIAVLPALSHAAPVDLGAWTAEGPGTWNVASPSSVTQTVNTTGPTALFDSALGKGYTVTGTFGSSHSDDDFIGFVLGYPAGGFASATADYIIIDWKQANQTYESRTATAGLNAWRVTNGALPHNGATWGHANPPFTHLGAAATLGSTGWVRNQTYDFVLTFTHDLIELSIDGNVQLSLAGPFPDGAIGLYNYSQPTVVYTVTDASLLNYTVTANTDANGSVDNASQDVDYDGSATVTFTPNAGYQLGSVTDTCGGGALSGNSYTVAEIRADCEITANFTSAASHADANAVPVPATGSLALFGLAGMLLLAARRRLNLR